MEKTTTVTTTDGRVREFHESVRLYSSDEMVHMLRAEGLEDVLCYGSLDGRACSVDDRRLILVAKKGVS